MILLKDNKLVYVDTSEDTESTIIAIKSLEDLKKDKYESNCIKDVIYTLGTPRFSNDGKVHLFKMTQSPYKDGSGIGDGFNGAHETKGEAISNMLKAGFKVYKDGIEILP